MATCDWSSLTPPQKKLLARLYGGGSIRNQEPAVIASLQGFGLIWEGRLSQPGLELCRALAKTLAIRRSVDTRRASPTAIVPQRRGQTAALTSTKAAAFR
jgi:hypothetical protein